MKALENVIRLVIKYRKLSDPKFKKCISIDRKLECFDRICEALDEADLQFDEPLFVIRGQDIAAADGIEGYRLAAASHGATLKFQEAVNKRARQFREWQRLRQNCVKRPD